MNDNDIEITRQVGGERRTVVVDGEAADFERLNNRVKDRQEDEEAKKKQHQNYLAHMEAAKKALAEAEYAKRRKQVYLTFGLVLSVAALMALSWTGLMHIMVGMAFIAGDAAAFGWQIGRNR